MKDPDLTCCLHRPLFWTSLQWQNVKGKYFKPTDPSQQTLLFILSICANEIYLKKNNNQL